MADGTIVFEITADNSKAVNSLNGVERKGESAGKKLGSALKTGALAASVAIAGLASASYASFKTIEEGANSLLIATGATGDAADELKAVYMDVAKSVSGSFEDVGAAVGELNTRLGSTGDELEAQSEAAMKFAKVNGTDVVGSIQSVTRMMNNAEMPSSLFEDTLGKLTKAAQASGASVDSLADSVQQNASTMDAMGLSMYQQIAFMANLEVTGANTSKVMRGLKTATAEWTAEGKNAGQEFKNFVDGVQSGSITAQDAIDTFGASTGQVMYDAAQSGQLSYDDMFSQVANSSSETLDQVYEDTLTVEDKLEILKKNVETKLAGIAEPVADTVSEMLDTVTEKVGEDASVGEIAQALYDMFGDALQELADSFTAQDVADVIASLSEKLNEATDPSGGAVGSALGEIGAKVVAGIGQGIREHGGELVGAIADALWNALDMGIAGLIAGMTGTSIQGNALSNGEFKSYTMGSDGTVKWNAAGGVYGSPQTIGVGEAGPEVVMPLRDDVLESIGKAIGGTSKGSTTINITVSGMQDADQFAAELAQSLNRMSMSGAI